VEEGAGVIVGIGFFVGFPVGRKEGLNDPDGCGVTVGIGLKVGSADGVGDIDGNRDATVSILDGKGVGETVPIAGGSDEVGGHNSGMRMQTAGVGAVVAGS
jgi:hypothetical protein